MKLKKSGLLLFVCTCLLLWALHFKLQSTFEAGRKLRASQGTERTLDKKPFKVLTAAIFFLVTE